MKKIQNLLMSILLISAITSPGHTYSQSSNYYNDYYNDYYTSYPETIPPVEDDYYDDYYTSYPEPIPPVEDDYYDDYYTSYPEPIPPEEEDYYDDYYTSYPEPIPPEEEYYCDSYYHSGDLDSAHLSLSSKTDFQISQELNTSADSLALSDLLLRDSEEQPDFNSKIYQQFVGELARISTCQTSDILSSINNIDLILDAACPSKQKIMQLAQELLKKKAELKKLNSLLGTTLGKPLGNAILESKLSTVQAEIDDLKQQIDIINADVNSLIMQNDESLQSQIDDLYYEAATLTAKLLAKIAEKQNYILAKEANGREELIARINAVLQFLSNCLHH